MHFVVSRTSLFYVLKTDLCYDKGNKQIIGIESYEEILNFMLVHRYNCAYVCLSNTFSMLE